MFTGKRKGAGGSGEVRWIITFADLITLLFCFFVYLSLFSKPQVSIKGQFKVTEPVLSSLQAFLPTDALGQIRKLMGATYEIEAEYAEQLGKQLGPELMALYQKRLILTSLVKMRLSEQQLVSRIGVMVSDKVGEEIHVPLHFTGSARRGPTDATLCTDEGLQALPLELMQYDYLLGREMVTVRKDEQVGYLPLCLINDDLFELDETIVVQIGTLEGNVERGSLISKEVVISDDEPLPKVSFEIDRREIYEGSVNVTVHIQPISGVETIIPLGTRGSAKEGVDYRFPDGKAITIYPYTEKGSIALEVMQEDVPLYATRSLIVEILSEKLQHAETGKADKQFNTIVGALEMKDCSGIHRFLRENAGQFEGFELNATKSRCILSLPSAFLFRSGKATLLPKRMGKLREFMTTIRNRYELEGDAIRVEGHTDDVRTGPNSPFANNWELGTIRATNVAVFMIKQAGFDPNLLAAAGYADTRPRVPLVDASGKRKRGKPLREARQANRRVDIIFTRPPATEVTRRFFP